MSDKFWGQDTSILIDTQKLHEFFPTSDQTLAEKVNSISRLIVYTCGVIAIYQKNGTALQYGLFLLIVIFVMWNKRTVTEKFECTKPTSQNPFMNHLQYDPYDKPVACVGKETQELASNLLHKQLFEDIDDLFDKRANERLFMTNPSTSRIPDREKFANWLAAGQTDCKTDGICPPFEDLRYTRKEIPEFAPEFNF